MMRPAYAVQVRELTKTYRMYRRPYDRLKEVVLRRPLHQPFQALKDISFEVPVGETFGVIGSNGAGKSTLLKILAGTLTPTRGEVIKHGSVAALLELGAGFHPEFTGRQNIYLNASLLGLSEALIEEKEPRIIDFCELGDFIDRPIKTYSSGMVMKLAFSIATSVDPDILIVDEALSVGDQRFQQKSANRMMQFRQSGKTIIVCSHSMYMVNQLCSKTLWLENGEPRRYGDTSKVIADYIAYMEGYGKESAQEPKRSRAKTASVPEIVILEVRLMDESGIPLARIEQFQSVVVQIKTRRMGPPLPAHLGIGIERPDGQMVFATTTQVAKLKPSILQGDQVTEVFLPSVPLRAGSYRVKAVVADQHSLRAIHELSTETFPVDSDHPELGMVWMEHRWRAP